jgi:hypothetical protein
MRSHKVLTSATILALLLSAIATISVSAAPLQSSSSATRQIASSGTSSPQTGEYTPSGDGDVTQAEFPGQEDEADGGPGPYPGTIVDRSLSNGTGHGVSVNSGKKAKSNPQFKFGFEGLNHYQQRYARGGNQFSLEPPDQGLCVGNGYVLEAVNDVLNIFNSSGQSVLPDNTATNIVGGLPRNVNHAVDLNSFYGYAPAVNRTTGARGQFVTDPSCLYDAATQRFFVVVLTLEVKPTAPSAGGFLGPNHLDIAVSNTSNPTGSWTIYRIPVQDDGTQGTPDHHCTHIAPPPAYRTNPNACLGDYPHIGADANGFYITTNEYEFFGNAFIGAQIYAISKSQLASTPASISVTQFDTSHSGVGGKPGFTIWPAQSPGTGSFNLSNGGTENFLSSDAADEAQCDSGAEEPPCSGTGTSNHLLVWALTNTSSLNSVSPALNLTNNVLTVGQYAIPPKQKQPGWGTTPGTDVPQGHCINDTTTQLFIPTLFGCWQLLFNPPEPAHDEVISRPDSNDTRMQQVMYANGKLWGALDTALNPDGGPQRAGIAWYIVNPSSSNLVLQGYLGATGHDFTYPAIGVTPSGRGVMAFTATGDALNPSAAFAPIDAIVGVGAWNVVNGGSGAAQDDGFTSYKSQVGNPPRTRWGDYGAAAVDGNSVWIASEYIAHACDYTTWGGPFFFGGTGDNLLGTCAASAGAPGTRSALANWSTRISKLTP